MPSFIDYLPQHFSFLPYYDSDSWRETGDDRQQRASCWDRSHAAAV